MPRHGTHETRMSRSVSSTATDVRAYRHLLSLPHQIPRLHRLRRTASRRLQTTRPMSVEGPLDLYFNDSPPSGDGAHGEIQVFGRSFARPRLSERWAPWARISFTATSESPGFTSTPRMASRSTRIDSPRRTPSSAVARTQ